ncbi:MAG: 4,5-DOPA dioxygenase extradiol [Clostridiaceae bacterium]
MARMPVLFVGHGSPMNAIEQNTFSDRWIALGKEIPRPEAILCVSAHWYTRGTRLNTAAVPNMIYDMYGFPDELYRVQYPAPGSPKFARQAKELLGDLVKTDNGWGLDHGAWSVLKRIFPGADIPVFQLSVDAASPLEKHYAIGKALRPLRDYGVLILGSGNIVHNLAKVNWNLPGGYSWAADFNGYIKTNVLTRQDENAIRYERAGSSAYYAFTMPDHYAPLLYALGATGEEDEISVFNDACVMGSLSMTSYRFG